MLQYFGEASREEIMKNTYTLDEEKEIRESLRLREIEKQQKIKIAAKKMEINTGVDETDPETMKLQDILASHKKANEELFKKMMAVPMKQHVRRGVQSTHAQHYNKRVDLKQQQQFLGVNNSSNLGLKDNTMPITSLVQLQLEDDELVKKSTVSLQMPDFYVNEELLDEIEKDRGTQTEQTQREDLSIQGIGQSKQVLEEGSQVDLMQEALKGQDENTLEDGGVEKQEQENDTNRVLSGDIMDEGNDGDGRSQQSEDEPHQEEEHEEINQNEISQESVPEEEDEEQGQHIEIHEEEIKHSERSDGRTSQRKEQTKVIKKVADKKTPKSTVKKHSIEAKPMKTVQVEETAKPSKKKRLVAPKPIVEAASPEISLPVTVKIQEKVEKPEKTIKIDLNTVTSPTPSYEKKLSKQFTNSVAGMVVKTPKPTRLESKEDNDGSTTKKLKEQKEKQGQAAVIENTNKRTSVAPKKRKENEENDDEKEEKPAEPKLSKAEMDRMKKKEEERQRKEDEKQRKEDEKQRKEEERERKKEEKRLANMEEKQKKREEEKRFKEEEERKVREEAERVKKLKEEEERLKKEEAERLKKEERMKKINEELAKMRQFNFAEELEILRKRKLTVRQMKQEIEYSIGGLANSKDEEVLYNILSYKQRMEQIEHFLGALESSFEAAISSKQDIQEFVNQVFDYKNRWTRDRYKDQFMKFQSEIHSLEPEQAGIFADVKGEAVGEQEIQMILKYASLNQDVDGVVQRLIGFKTDSEFLAEMKDIMQNFEARNMIQTTLDDSLLKEGKQKGTSERKHKELTNIKDEIEYNNKMSDQSISILQKLRRLKKRNPEEFSSVLSNSSQIKLAQSFLNAVNYVGINKEVIATQKIPSKANYWKIHQDAI